ncbi:MAG: 2,3-bisphosphoglycerate-independent phosphoglycerate mutase [Candidatus Puniceispirillaceae bacterium]
MAKQKPVVLCIMDGWGYRPDTAHNAVAQANTPHVDALMAKGPYCFLEASEEAVGLPIGQPGNSEVGHMTIGSGRIILQDLPRITQALSGDFLNQSDEMAGFIAQLKKTGGRAHLLGLCSNGGVHAHLDHIIALANHLASAGLEVMLHVITDGRDTLPQAAQEQLRDLHERLAKTVVIASVCGRYFAMDRDSRWARTGQFFDLITKGEAADHAASLSEAIENRYAAGETDEFLSASILPGHQNITAEDGVLMANFRVDRARQIMAALFDNGATGCALEGFEAPACGLLMAPLANHLDDELPVLFGAPDLSGGFGELVSAAGLRQLRLAETEKYPHVTFFFNGGVETPFEGEDRQMVPSPKVATYDLAPEMSAREVLAIAVNAVQTASHEVIIVNFANPDMVGHCGDLNAAIKAVETVDAAVGQLSDAVLRAGGAMLVTADHGNCETMWDEAAASPHTAHTTVKVVCMLVGGPENITLRDGGLADLAPSLLALLGLDPSHQMTGKSLLITS